MAFLRITPNVIPPVTYAKVSADILDEMIKEWKEMGSGRSIMGSGRSIIYRYIDNS
jgi:hypothetical protein